MSPDTVKAENEILNGWIDHHLKDENRNREKYERGAPVLHKYMAGAHARAALALQRELDGA